MCYLDFILIFAVFAFFACGKKLSAGEDVFGRETTASLRGLLMLGIILHHIYKTLGENSFVLSKMGYLATGLFFFISGFGNTLSLNNYKEKGIRKVEWLWNKFKKIYIPFVACYLFYYVVVLFFYKESLPSLQETVIDLFIISLPNMVSWFPKIILMCFCVHWLATVLFRNKTLQFTALLLSVVAYIYIFWRRGYPLYWINSVLCYPIGCMFQTAGLLDKITAFFRKYKYASLAASVAAFLGAVFMRNYETVFSVLAAVFFSTTCYFYACIIKTKTKFFSWIGKNSFAFYLFHLACQQLCATFENNRALYTALVLLSSMVTVYAYQKTSLLIKGTMQKFCNIVL